MDLINKILPLLWAIVENKKNCSANIATIDNKLTINIILGRKRKRFVYDNDELLLIRQLSSIMST